MANAVGRKVTLGVRVAPPIRATITKMAEAEGLHFSALARTLLTEAVQDRLARESGTSARTEGA